MIEKDFFWIENETLSLLITTKCNQNCIMCPQHLNDDFIDHDLEVQNFISRIEKLHCKEIYITGGEPFLKSKLIDYIFLNTKKEKIIILTNGSIMPSEVILKSHRVSLCIPLYASYDDLHNSMTGGEKFYRIIKNLIDISVYKVPIELRFLITNLNYKNMIDFSIFVTRNLPFVSNIAFMGLELMENAAFNSEKLWINPKEYMTELCKAIDYLKIFNMPVSIYNIPYCLIPKDYHSYAYKSISEWKRKYFDFCNSCIYSKDCGGFFESCTDVYKKIIKEPVQ
jgi:His-Xaa-Ser system radical SAM maturase HxsC